MKSVFLTFIPVFVCAVFFTACSDQDDLSGTDGGTDTNTGTDTDSDTDSDTDTNTGTDTDTDTDTDIDEHYQWHTFYGSSNDLSKGEYPSSDLGASVVVDAEGNVYVTGFSYYTWTSPSGQEPLHEHSGNRDIYVLKLNSSGAYQWHTFYGSYYHDNGYSLAVDAEGNVYVTGTSDGTWTGPSGQEPLHAYSGPGDDEDNCDLYVLKLNSSGAYQWHTFYSCSFFYGDIRFSVAVDAGGNIYIAGESDTAWTGPSGQEPLHEYSGFSDLYVLKLNSSGAYQWHTFYGSPSDDLGYSVSVDAGNNVYVTGYSDTAWTGPSGQEPLHAHSDGDVTHIYDLYVLKLNSSGAYQWHTFYGSPSDDLGYSVAVDAGSNVYVTGNSLVTWTGPSGQEPLHAHSGGEVNRDLYVLKLNSSGAYQWHTFYGSYGWEAGESVAVDTGGNVYVTGYSLVTWTGPSGQEPLHEYSADSDLCVLKLSSSGAYQWHTFYGCSYDDLGYSVAVDAGNNVYVTGYSDTAWTGPSGQDSLHEYSGSGDIYILKLVE